MLKQLQLSFAFLFLAIISNAQPSFQWVKQMGGTGDDAGNAIAIDASGNAYTTGSFKGISDFDPGAGTYTLSSNGVMADIFVSKLDASGNFLWAKSFGSIPADEEGNGIAVDASGNVYVTGTFNGTVDFDPGPASYTLTSSPSSSGFVLKLDGSGNFAWAKKIGGATGSVNPYALAIDASANVYTTGYFTGTADLDPGAATYTVANAGSTDVYVSKLDASGNFVWGKVMGGPDIDVAYAITADASGNVYTTGNFQTTGDFDPGVATYTIAAGGNADIFISKLDVNGNFTWAKSMMGSTGNNSGGRAIKLDASNNVYTGGFFGGTVDFNPGAATYTLNAAGSNGFISKLDAGGNYVWAKQISSNNSCIVYALTLDATANVYATGSYDGTTDFDPGAATSFSTATGGDDAYILKLDASGNYVWAQDLGGPASYSNVAKSIALNTLSGNIYLTGQFDGTVDFDFGTGTTNLTPSGSNSFDVFVELIGQPGFCTAPSVPTNTTPAANQTICSGNTATIMATSTGTVSWYATPTNTTVLGTGNTYTTASLTAGTYTYYAEAGNSCTVNATRTAITLTVNVLPVITANSGIICNGSSFTITPGGAGTYTFSSGSAVVNPTTTTSYSVTGTSALGCVSSNTAVSSVTVNTTPTITVNSGSICNGTSFTITPGGAATYTISGGSSVVSPTSTTTYSVTGTSAFGCIGSNTALSTVTVNTRPTISVNSGSVCSGNSFTMVATGANTYTYSSGTPVVTPTITGISMVIASYTITGASAFGCTSSNVAISSLTVYALPVINAVSNNTLLCAGQSAVLTASGANSYTWSTGVNTTTASVSPTVTTLYTVTGMSSSTGCRNNASITQSVSACTSVFETEEMVFTVYPNPSNGNFIIQSGKALSQLQVDLFDATGRLVFSKQFQNPEELVSIGLTDYAKGIYVLKLNYDGKQSHQKMILE
ncbi:MAG: SBBP repeat-containing protein [Bacteroidota bacterium]